MAVKIHFFESIAKEIQGKFYRVNQLLNKANQKSGEYHEEILRNSLRNFLPNRFTVKTGYIYLDDQKHSKQIDILVIDENCPFTYLLQDRDFVIVRPEAVVAAIEVKTELKEKAFKESFENIFVAKKLKSESLGGLHGHMMGFVFGYSSNVNLNNKILGNWFKSEFISKYYDEISALWPDSFFFFENGLYLHRDANHKFDKTDGPEAYYKFYRDTQGNDQAWQLSFLIALIISCCEASASSGMLKVAPLKALDIVDVSNASFSFDGFRPKLGHFTRN